MSVSTIVNLFFAEDKNHEKVDGIDPVKELDDISRGDELLIKKGHHIFSQLRVGNYRLEDDGIVITDGYEWVIDSRKTPPMEWPIWGNPIPEYKSQYPVTEEMVQAGRVYKLQEPQLVLFPTEKAA